MRTEMLEMTAIDLAGRCTHSEIGILELLDEYG